MGENILVVDDSASMRQLVSFAMTDAGYSVVSAVNGEEGLKKAKSEKIRMLITDLNMPGMDGLELVRQVRGLPGYRFIPIIMLTTESHESRIQEGKRAGASGWIVKPFTPEQLVSVVNKFLK